MRSPPVVAVSELVHVILKPLPTNTMMRAINRAFKLGPKALNCVRVTLPTDIFLLAVVDDFVLVAVAAAVVVDGKFIGVNRCAALHISVDVSERVGGGDSPYNFCLNGPAALNDPYNWSFATGAAASLAGPLSPVVGFICFHDALEFARVFVHQLANLVSHAPRRLVGDADLAFNFFGCHAIARGCHQEHGKEPLGQGCLGFVENCPCGWRELVAAPRAGIALPRLDAIERVLFGALWARRFRPTLPENEVQTSRIVRELLVELR